MPCRCMQIIHLSETVYVHFPNVCEFLDHLSVVFLFSFFFFFDDDLCLNTTNTNRTLACWIKKRKKSKWRAQKQTKHYVAAITMKVHLNPWNVTEHLGWFLVFCHFLFVVLMFLFCFIFHFETEWAETALFSNIAQSL